MIETYQHLCSGLLAGLNRLGVSAKFSPGSESFYPNLYVKKRKISGNAQSRRGNTLLQHGTILRNLDLYKMFAFLKVNKQISFTTKFTSNFFFFISFIALSISFLLLKEPRVK